MKVARATEDLTEDQTHHAAEALRRIVVVFRNARNPGGV
jgi:hypothetical protein